MDSTIVLIAYLFVRPGREASFHEFETEAARIMRRYGGRIDRVIHPTSSVGGDPLPYEIHVLSFPSLGRFEGYQEDRDLAGLASLRRSAIARTQVMIGEEGEPYFDETGI